MLGLQRGNSVTLDQSHTLFALTAGRAVAAVKVCVQVALSHGCRRSGRQAAPGVC